jgi:type VI secretion system protein VasJ
VAGKDLSMDINVIRTAIREPISVDQPVGENAVHDPLYEFVDDQMMKVGSLSHGSVQWDKAEKSLIELLSKKTKDLKLLTYFFQCLHNKNTPDSLALSIFVLADFMSEYWEICFPFAGKKGNLPRRKFLGQIIQRFGLALDKLDFTDFNSVERDNLIAANTFWHDVVKEKELDSENVEIVIDVINRKLQNSEKKRLETEEKAQSQAEPKQAEELSSKPAIEVDNSSAKSTKQTLLKVADFLSENENSVELAIRIRRYAVWSSITTLPDNVNKQTLINALPQERVKEYWSSLDKPDVALWKRVEATLTVAPYWFDGQFLSFQIAEKLGYTESAQAILVETQRFLQRFPSLYDFTFKDGEAFITATCQAWLEQVNETDLEASNLSGNSWAERKKIAVDLVDKEGIGAALSMINEGISNAVEPRDNYYWRLISTELLEENKLNDLAQQQFQQLHTQVQSMSVSEWEPSLLKRVKKHITVK